MNEAANILGTPVFSWSAVILILIVLVQQAQIYNISKRIDDMHNKGKDEKHGR